MPVFCCFVTKQNKNQQHQLGKAKKKCIVGLRSDQSSRIDAAMRSFVVVDCLFFFIFFKTLFYLMDYFNTVLNRPSVKLDGTSMPFCKWWTQAVSLFLIAFNLEISEIPTNIWCGAVIFMEIRKN